MILVVLTGMGPLCGDDGLSIDVPAVPLPHYSDSRQFLIVADDPRVRSAFSGFAEQVKKAYMRLLKQEDPDAWKHSISLRIEEGSLENSDQKPVHEQVLLVGDELALRLTVRLNESFTRQRLYGALTRMLMVEQILRFSGKPEALTGDQRLIPYWLEIGLPEVLVAGQGNDRGLFASIFKNDQVLPLKEILSRTRGGRDSISRAVYAASAAGFVRTLEREPLGGERLSALISNLGDRRHTVRSLLHRHYPALKTSEAEQEKWWALKVAALAKPKADAVWDAKRTDQALERALRFTLFEFAPDGPAVGEAEEDSPETGETRTGKKRGFFGRLFGKKSKPGEKSEEKAPPQTPAERVRPTVQVEYALSDYGKFIRRVDRPALMQGCENRLIQLSLRAFPLYIGIIQDYQKMVKLIELGRTEGIDAQLVALAEERK
ncbi:MAG: hypothetical protein AAF514_13155, partial [Verrucomicrobiota bacterium]